jgi:hypothetical protein
VAPGEVFAFDPSMVEDVGPTPRRSGTTLFVILGILLVAGAAAGILYATGAFSGKKKGTSKPDDSMAAMEPGSQKDPKAYQSIQTLLTQKDWKSAIRDADALLIEDQQDSEAKRFRDKAVEEQKNEELKNLFFSALRDGDPGKAFEEGSKIPSDSVYHAEVSTRLEQEKLKLKTDLVARARELHKANKCPELSEISKKIHAVDPAETSVSALLRSCKAPEVADAMTPGTEDPRRDPPPPRDMTPDSPPDRPRPMDPPPPMDPERPATGGAAAAAELYEQALKAWRANDCSKAIALADEANRKQFSGRHVSIIGACACTLGNQGRANWAYKILKGGQRNILVQVCKAKGINLP